MATGNPWNREEDLRRCSSCAIPERSRKGKQSLYFIPESVLQRMNMELEAERGLRPEDLSAKQPVACAHWEAIPLQNGPGSEGEV